MKYNIALVPHNTQQFIDYAHHTPYAANKNTYLIGKRSLPHITLCHFTNHPDNIEKIWQVVQAQQLDQTTWNLQLGFIRSTCYPERHPKDGMWVSLIPNHIPELTALHLKIATIIEHPTNLAWDQYDPHLTLLNNKVDFSLCQSIALPTPIHPPFEDYFSIALGHSDVAGQLTELLYP